MNYRIIGADGNPYGPATEEQIRQWIAQGRANGQTSIQAEGATEWKPLASFPEFADALAAKATPPLPQSEPPVVTGPDPQALANEVIARGVDVNIGSCLSRGWDAMLANFWPMVGVSALIWILTVAASSVSVGIVVVGPLMGGLLWYFLKHIRGQRPTVQDAFAGFTLAFVQLLLVGLISGLLTAIGLLLCLIPGIYLMVAWSLALLLVIDKRLEFWDAMEVSRKVVNQRWWSFFGLLLICWLLDLLGTLCFCVGSFITSAWGGLAIVYAYEDLFGSAAAVSPKTLAPVDLRGH